VTPRALQSDDTFATITDTGSGFNEQASDLLRSVAENETKTMQLLRDGIHKIAAVRPTFGTSINSGHGGNA
jgi:hypothetical protein